MLQKIPKAAFFYYLLFFKMFKFLKGSIREFKHVVWPTHSETKKYFLIVFTLLLTFGIYLFIASTVMSEILLQTKSIITGTPNITVEEIPVMSGETTIIETQSGSVIEETETLTGTVAE